MQSLCVLFPTCQCFLLTTSLELDGHKTQILQVSTITRR